VIRRCDLTQSTSYNRTTPFVIQLKTNGLVMTNVESLTLCPNSPVFYAANSRFINTSGPNETVPVGIPRHLSNADLLMTTGYHEITQRSTPRNHPEETSLLAATQKHMCGIDSLSRLCFMTSTSRRNY